MYNIGILPTNNQNNNTYTKQLSKATYKLHSFTEEEMLSEAPKMDALIIEESLTNGLTHTCELILELRRRFNALIWIVSKNLTRTSKIVYLQLGADGVIDDEHEQEESILQLSNILNRVKSEKISLNEPIYKEKLENSLALLPSNLSIVLNGEIEIGLTRLEFQTIAFLLDHSGTAVTYKEIYNNVWKDKFEDPQDGNKQYRVSNLIFHLRKKLEKDQAQPQYIKTIRSKGYMLVL